MNNLPKNGYLTRKSFFWTIGIFVTILGMTLVPTLSYIIGKQDTLSKIYNHSVTEIKVDIAEIKTDLKLLRQSLK